LDVLLFTVRFFLTTRRPPISPLFPYTTLFRSIVAVASLRGRHRARAAGVCHRQLVARDRTARRGPGAERHRARPTAPACRQRRRSEEHTSGLQSLTNLVCRLLLENEKHQPTHS